MMENDDSDYLMLSGINHFTFCRRRWALIHIEQQWDENSLTLEGHYMHEQVHDDGFTELRGSVLFSRGMPVRSHRLEVTGVCDMLELHRDDNGVHIQGRDGQWRLYPVEYKHGRPNPRGSDELQLCAQAMCLEEMFVTDIPEGEIYYGETHRRLRVDLTPQLRGEVESALDEMRRLYKRGYTPRVKPSRACKSCSMHEICQPELLERSSARDYVRKVLAEGDEKL